MQQTSGGQLKFAHLRPFSNTIFSKEFGVTFNPGNGALVQVYQKIEDIEKFGDITLEGGSDIVNEFRSAVNAKEVIPVISTRKDDKEIFPLYVVPYKDGYLIIAGMNLASVEFKKLVKTTSNFVDYLEKLQKQQKQIEFYAKFNS